MGWVKTEKVPALQFRIILSELKTFKLSLSNANDKHGILAKPKRRVVKCWKTLQIWSFSKTIDKLYIKPRQEERQQ